MKNEPGTHQPACFSSYSVCSARPRASVPESVSLYAIVACRHNVKRQVARSMAVACFGQSSFVRSDKLGLPDSLTSYTFVERHGIRRIPAHNSHVTTIALLTSNRATTWMPNKPSP